MFPIGTWARANPSLIQAMKRDGQVIDNHTATHADLSTASTSTVLREIDHGARPSTSVWLLRPPGGAGAFSTQADRPRGLPGVLPVLLDGRHPRLGRDDHVADGPEGACTATR